MQSALCRIPCDPHCPRNQDTFALAAVRVGGIEHRSRARSENEGLHGNPRGLLDGAQGHIARGGAFSVRSAASREKDRACRDDAPWLWPSSTSPAPRVLPGAVEARHFCDKPLRAVNPTAHHT